MEQNYLPLFRKYRPQSFKDIVGQESLVKALSNAIELNRIASAYLFCGPRGTGKTSSARIFAKSLNCEHGPTLEPCQKCASCVDITNASGLDVIEIDAASNRGIQDAKDLISQVQYAPINGKYKIFIIDEVHMLSNDAFNALLKTFEEPPKNVIFILATTEPHKVLETIVSRCQRFDLRRITVEDIIKRLDEIAHLENIKITKEALYTIAKNVSGGLRDSLALLDQVSILGVKEEITKDLIEELLGKINFDILLNLLRDINDENIEKVLKDVDEIYAKGNEPRNLAENFMEFLRNVILTLNSSDNETIIKLTTLINDDIEKIRTCNFDKDKIIKILNTLVEYYKEIKISTNPYLWMELACLAVSRLDLLNSKQVSVIKSNIQTTPPLQTVQKQAPVQNVQNVQKEPVQTEIKPKAAEKEPIPEPVQVNQVSQNTKNDDPAQIWLNIVSKIPSLPARAFYSGVAKLVGIEGNKIKLGFMHENAIAQAKSKLAQLQSAIQSCGGNYETEFVKINQTTQVIELKSKISRTQPSAQVQPPQVKPQSAPPVSNAIKPSEDIEQEEEMSIAEKKHYSPEVQDMIEQFSGRIID